MHARAEPSKVRVVPLFHKKPRNSRKVSGEGKDLDSQGLRLWKQQVFNQLSERSKDEESFRGFRVSEDLVIGAALLAVALVTAAGILVSALTNSHKEMNEEKKE